MRYLVVVLFLVGCATAKDIRQASDSHLCYAWYFTDALTEEMKPVKEAELQRRNIRCVPPEVAYSPAYSPAYYPPYDPYYYTRPGIAYPITPQYHYCTTVPLGDGFTTQCY